VSQATLRVTKTFWSLDSDLAYKKHFPSINWLTSYSLYAPNFEEFWAKEVAPDFSEVRKTAMNLLEKESKLLEIVRLVGMESLSNSDRLVLKVAGMIREDFLFQDAFSPDDAYTPLANQYGLLKSIVNFYELGKDVVTKTDFEFAQFANLQTIADFQKLKSNTKATPEDYQTFQAKTEEEIAALA
jgi:V/A-type H+-transporting ATPase subunit A